jgi:hypothetical protein
MSPHQTFSRIPLQVGSELRIRNTGEVSVNNPPVETAALPSPAGAVLDYRFDAQTGEHVLRLAEPVSQPDSRRRRSTTPPR